MMVLAQRTNAAANQERAFLVAYPPPLGLPAIAAPLLRSEEESVEASPVVLAAHGAGAQPSGDRHRAPQSRGAPHPNREIPCTGHYHQMVQSGDTTSLSSKLYIERFLPVSLGPWFRLGRREERAFGVARSEARQGGYRD